MRVPGPLGQPTTGAAPVQAPVGARTAPPHPHHVAGKKAKTRRRAKFIAHQDGPDTMPPAAYFSSQGWKFRREQFFASLDKQKFPAIKGKQKDHLDDLLGYIENDKDVTDLRWIAYMLATVRRECGASWLPVEEGGKGSGHRGKAATPATAGKPAKPAKPGYGDPVTVKDKAGKSYSNVYYGRGFVQLTWERNYASCGAELHRLNLVISDDELVIHPERALEPALAYPIMSFGMRKGIFTGVTLKKYIHGAAVDYFNSRRIINGTDVAAVIEGYAVMLEKALYEAVAPVENFQWFLPPFLDPFFF